MSEVKQVDIKIYSGEDFSMTFIARDPDTTIAKDLTGAAVTAQLRKYPSGTNPFDFTITNYGASGKVQMTMPHETTARIGYAYGRYEVKAVYEDGTTETLLWGLAFVLPAVTRIVTGTAETILAFNSFDEFPEVGTYYRLYLDVTAGLLYRWNGTMYENALVGLAGGKGNDGVGIYSIVKSSTEGNVDTYLITYTDGSTSTFTVTNGASIIGINKIGEEGTTVTYAFELSDGNEAVFNVQNGSSIENISWSDTDGITDTYTITLTDGTTSTFQVRNGLDGLGAPVHVEGEIAVVTSLLPDQLSLTEVRDEIAYVGALLPDTDWAMLDTGTSLASGSYIYIRKVGYQVMIIANKIKLSADLTGDSITLATLSEGFRPNLFDVVFQAGNISKQGLVSVEAGNGNLTFYKTDNNVSWGTADEISFTLTYIMAAGNDPTPEP